eukprot:5382979-Prymnesium_polylepis.1
MQGAGTPAHEAGPKLSKTAQQLKQRRLWLGKGKAPTGETMAPKGAPQEAVASSASDSAHE